MIPLARPDIDAETQEAITAVLRSGRLVQGPQVEAFEAMLAAQTGYPHAVAVSSGTAALFLAMSVLKVGPGVRVVCPGLTWPSPAHAARLLGAPLRLLDVDAETWNSRPDHVTAAVEDEGTPTETVTVAIDQFGSPCEAEALGTAAPGPVIRDAACSLGSAWGPVPGVAVACLSFHPRKVVTTGEGGACLTDDPALARALRVLRNHGQGAPGVFATPGHNFRLGEVAAAMGIGQLRSLPDRVQRRQAIAARYRAALPDGVTGQATGPLDAWNVQTFGIQVPGGQRDRWISMLQETGVQGGRLSYALSRVASLAEATGSCPTAEGLEDRGLALPMFAGLSDDEVDKVTDALQTCAKAMRET